MKSKQKIIYHLIDRRIKISESILEREDCKFSELHEKEIRKLTRKRIFLNVLLDHVDSLHEDSEFFYNHINMLIDNGDCLLTINGFENLLLEQFPDTVCDHLSSEKARRYAEQMRKQSKGL